ncbi:MAG: EAL domain-containing protein [Gammaproteobacteria bacterium]
MSAAGHIQPADDIVMPASVVAWRHKSLAALLRIATKQEVTSEERIPALTAAAAALLDVQRVSLWRFNDNRESVYCCDFYDRAGDRHGTGLELTASLYPSFFSALDGGTPIFTTKPAEDPRTAQLAISYLEPFEITALLAVPVMIDGTLGAVLSFERTGAVKPWMEDDPLLATTIAALVTVILQRPAAAPANTESKPLSEESAETAVAAIRASERRQRALLDAMPDTMLRLNRDGVILDYSCPWGVLPGADGLAVGGSLDDPNVSEELRNIAFNMISRALDSGDIEAAEYAVRGPRGPEHFEARFVRSGKDEVVAILRNITKQKQAEARALYLANFDPLTNLPNRVLLLDRMQQMINSSARFGRRLAVMYIDLDHFKRINDMLGQGAGDQLLQIVAEDLRGCLRDTDTIARVAGDEYIIVASGNGTEDAIHLCDRIMQKVSQPYQIVGTEVSITPSIGISVYPDDGSDTDTLIRNAESALHYAKERGRASYRFFAGEMNEVAHERISLESNLRGAVDNSEFLLNYQLQADLFSGQFTGVESLVRWKSPTRGMVPPGKFIGVAEDCGIIVQLGKWILREACLQNAEWQLQKLPRITMAVNISALQFQQHGFVDFVRETLADTGLDPRYLELEITESVVMNDLDATIASLKSLKDLGVQLAMDDFGTGFSSLSYLRRLPIDKLKIDRSFVVDAHQNSEDAAIVHAIISMAHSLGLKVIAEGVETKQQLLFLRRMQCDEVQGFYLSKPLSPEECAERLSLGRQG